ncbi:glutamate racemase [Clostridia bacterium]|nr:glutamate racemase [Clostridia bacterium]
MPTLADSRPVGVFDSGLGGLTAVRAIKSILPSQDILYLGDTARLPYGTKSDKVIVQYALEGLRFFLRRNVKALVIACGTMSTVAPEALSAASPVPVLTVVGPAAAEAAAATKSRRVGLIATPASVRSNVYEKALLAIDPAIRVTARACPLFVPLVENGRVTRGDIVLETVAREYLADLKAARVDTLALGCTHYPLLMDVISDVMGADVALIDAGAAVARALKRHLEAADALPPQGAAGTQKFFVTDTAEGFAGLAELFLKNSTQDLVDSIDILTD